MIDKNSLKALKFVETHAETDLSMLTNLLGNKISAEIALDGLIAMEYIAPIIYFQRPNARTHQLEDVPSGKYKITAQGIAILDNRKNDIFLKIYPLVVSTLSLLISLAVALFK